MMQTEMFEAPVTDVTVGLLRGRLLTMADAKKFIFAGNATVTLVSQKTGTRFTYRISKKKKQEEGAAPLYFVSLLRGTDNESDYAYMGIMVDGLFKRTAKSTVGEKAPSMVTWRWFADQMLADKPINEFLEVWHEDRCGRCGRKLTVPSSVSQGYGPECVNYVGGF